MCRSARRIGANRGGDSIAIGASCFTEGTDRVDRGDPLGEESVGGQFGEFAGPDVGREDSLAVDPVGVDVDEGLDGGGFAADKDAIGIEEVFDRGSFSEEFRTGENVDGGVAGGVREDALDGLGLVDCERRFLDHDFVASRNSAYLAGAFLDELKVGGFACAGAEGFGRGFDHDNDHVCGADGFVDRGGEV